MSSHERSRRSDGVGDQTIHNISRAVKRYVEDKRRPRSEERRYNRSREVARRPRRYYSLSPAPREAPRTRRYSSDGDHFSSRSSSSSLREGGLGGLKEEEVKRLEQAAIAALDAGAIAAIRARHGRGSWSGDKGFRVATAAVTAAIVNAFLAKNPGAKPARHLLESTIAGLVMNRVVNGSPGR